MMQHVIPLLVGRFGRRMAPCVFATDAEGMSERDCGGFGVVGARVPVDIADEALLVGPAGSRTITKLDGDISKLRGGQRELRRCYGVSWVPRQ